MERVLQKWLLIESLRLIVIILIIIIIQPVDLENESQKICQNVPSFCGYIAHSRKNHSHSIDLYTLTEAFACAKGFDIESAKQLDQLLNSCRKKNEFQNVSLEISISIRAARSSLSIVNDSFRPVLELNTKQPDKQLSTILKLSNLKGFDIDLSIMAAFKDAQFEFYTDFNLYKNNQVVKDCRDFVDKNSTKQRQFIIRGGYVNIRINRPRALYPVCSLFFRRSRISGFTLFTMAHSFYMKNSVRFVNDPDDIYDNKSLLDSRIHYLNFMKIYELDLDSRLLNAKIFAATIYIRIYGQLRSIESSVFSPIRQLRTLSIRSDTIMDLIRRQGIAWIKGINVNVSVNMTNLTDFKRHVYDIAQITFSSERENEHYFNSKNDEADFCLFVDFPFRQLVILKPVIFKIPYEKVFKKKISITCTELWLYQFYREYISVFGFFGNVRYDAYLKASNFSACEFAKRIQMCNRSNFHLSTTKRSTFTSFDIIIGLEFSFGIILPVLFGSFGIVTNTIVILVIFHEKNKKTMRKKQYIYMSLYCLSNVLICFIQFLNLLNECQYPYSGLFCSSIRHFVGIQYQRIIFGEYLNSVLRLVSNFAYFGFSICRLAKIGTNHSQFTVFFNEKLNIKVYMSVMVFISASLCVCKCLQFNLNHDNPDLAYPLSFVENPLKQSWTIESGYLAIFVINIIYNFINYFIFVFVHLIVDIVLIRKLRQVMREKEDKMREMKKSEKEMEKMSKENEESKRRAVIMVICNSSINFCLKTPLLIPALNDVRLLIYNSNRFGKLLHTQNTLNLFSSPFNFEFYCATEKSCQIFQSFGNCLFLVSLSTILFFFKHFDMNFKCAFQNVFHQAKKNSNKNQIK